MADWPGRQSRGRTSRDSFKESQARKREARKEFNESLSDDYRSVTGWNVGTATKRASEANIYREDSIVWHHNPKSGQEEITDNSRTRHERVWNRRDPKLLKRGNPFAMPADIKEQSANGTKRIRHPKDSEFTNRTPQQHKRFQPKARVYTLNEIDAENARRSKQ